MTYYERLGVRPDASVEEIRSAYRRAVRRVHPDANPEAGRPAARRLAELSEAWRVLRDPERRRGYDLSLQPAPRPLAPPPFVDPRPVRRRASPAAAAAWHPARRRSLVPVLGAVVVALLAVGALAVVLAARQGSTASDPRAGGPAPGVLQQQLADLVAGTVSEASPTHTVALGTVTGATGLLWKVDSDTGARLATGAITLSRDDGSVLCTALIDSMPAPQTVSGECDTAPTRVTLHLNTPVTGRPVFGDIRLDPLISTPAAP